jgi:Kef-type K+ transport system membrane component KefB
MIYICVNEQHHFNLAKIVQPLWTSALFFICALGTKWLLHRYIENRHDNFLTKYTTGSSIPYFMSVVTAFTLAATYGAQRAGSTYLLGTYMAGIVVSAFDTAEDAWEHSVGDAIRPWAGRLFFTATVGFAIPLRALVDPSNMLCGFVLTIAAILGKFLTGLWSASPKSEGYMLLFVQVGSAMVGRGELGFVVAKMALAMGLLHEKSFSACIWALLLATILGPFMFQFFLRYDKPEKNEEGGAAKHAIQAGGNFTSGNENDNLYQGQSNPSYNS